MKTPPLCTATGNVMLRLDRSIHSANLFGHATQEEVLRSSRRTTITTKVMLRLDRSIHYANWLGYATQGRSSDQVGGRRSDNGHRKATPKTKCLLTNPPKTGILSTMSRFRAFVPLQLETRNSKLETRNSKLETRNSKLETRNNCVVSGYFVKYLTR